MAAADPADGVSSILIGLVLACTSTLLARESKSLLIGEKADSQLIKSILAIANSACGSSRASVAEATREPRTVPVAG